MDDVQTGWAALADPEFEPLPDWLESLIDGKDCTDWVRVNWTKAAKVEGAWFDQAKADAVVALWPTIFKLTTLRFAGHPFRLSWWQEVIVRFLVGWKYPIEIIDPATGHMMSQHVRLFRELRLWVPRKNGKSEFLAALALLFWALDGMQGAEGYVFARNEEQAMLAFTKIKEMLRRFPKSDAAKFQINAGSVWCPSLASGFVVLTGASKGKHGKAPYVRFGDEMHEWETRKVEDDLRQGSGVHLQPIGLLASTAGVKTALTGIELWDETKAILDGTIDQPSTLAVVFAADADDDWLDEKVWAKANPNLNISVTLDSLRIEANKAKLGKRAEAHFRCYHLNQWVESQVSWLDIRAWDACAPDKAAWQTRREDMRGRQAILATDLSSHRDFTSKVLLFPPVEGERDWKLDCHFWLPEGSLKHFEGDKLEQVKRFIDLGAVTMIPGEVIDQDFVIEAVHRDLADFDIERIAFDRWKFEKMSTDLQKQGVDPELMLSVPMGIRTLSAPSEEFERLVYAGLMDHGGHPVLRWMARHCDVRFDENLNFMPAKKKSGEKIDGIMAAVIALAASMDEKETSVYEDRGMMVLG